MWPLTCYCYVKDIKSLLDMVLKVSSTGLWSSELDASKYHFKTAFPRPKRIVGLQSHLEIYLSIAKMLSSRVPQIYQPSSGISFYMNIVLFCCYLTVWFYFVTHAEIAKELGRIEHQYLSSPTSQDQKSLKGMHLVSAINNRMSWFNIPICIGYVKMSGPLVE